MTNDAFYLDGTEKSQEDLIKMWKEDVKSMTAEELFHHGTMELYHGGVSPDPNCFCGQAWLALKNETPGERIIDWSRFKDDIEDILVALDHYEMDKKNPDYQFLQTKLTVARAYESAQLLEDHMYTDLEITCLSFTVNGNRLEIPKNYFISNYNEVKQVMKNFEGKYSKNGFDFPYPAKQVLNRIRNQETMNLKKSFQYFGTPDKIADIMCVHAFDPYENKAVKVLEPEAGQGSIVDAVLRWFHDEAINIKLDSLHLIEFMDENYNILENKYSGANKLNPFNVPIKMKKMDFLQYDKRIDYFDVVIANPPFSKGQDIEHFYKMYEVCAPNGTIVSIMSPSFLNNSQKKFQKFREWLGLSDETWRDKVDLKLASGGGSEYRGYKLSPQGNDEQLYIKTFERGEFEESGTNVHTVMIVLKKNGLSGWDFEKPKAVKKEAKPVTTKTIPETDQLKLF